MGTLVAMNSSDPAQVKISQLSSHWSVGDGGVDCPVPISPALANYAAPAAGTTYAREHILIGDHGGDYPATHISAKPNQCCFNTTEAKVEATTTTTEQLSTHWAFEHPSAVDEEIVLCTILNSPKCICFDLLSLLIVVAFDCRMTA